MSFEKSVVGGCKLEIGSDFWLTTVPEVLTYETPIWLNIGEDHRLLFSGRTAIDYVLEDIRLERRAVQTVYMPSYCCRSMLQPYLDRGVCIIFYDVVSDDSSLKYLIDYEQPCDVFFATSYFGFADTVMDSAMEVFRRRGTVVVEDITHRILCQKAYCEHANYSIASLRKWLPLPCGALAAKHENNFHGQELRLPSSMVETVTDAMKKKAQYIHSRRFSASADLRIAFRTQLLEFEEALGLNYKGLMTDDLSKHLISVCDVESVKQKRRENALILCTALKPHAFIKPLIGESIDFARDCPLCFPVKVQPDVRSCLRDFLATRGIFCPIHWPIPNAPYLEARTRSIYEEELSLVCDQRYGASDMLRIMSAIEEFSKI